MNSIEGPNLFAYATSELSQDAFICWLAAWADSKWSVIDPTLHRSARGFIVALIHKVNPLYDPADLKTVTVHRQYEKIDILLEINIDLPNRLAILIEDKTHSYPHTDQLVRYYNHVMITFSKDQIIPIYLKTGYQSRFDVGEYRLYLRADFIDILQREPVDNAIYSSFLAHLKTMDLLIQQFWSNKLKWSAHDWIGFYMTLYNDRNKLDESSSIDWTNWGKVNNQSGGFYGFWWYFQPQQGNTFLPYLQLEEEILCYKLSLESPSMKEVAFHIRQQMSEALRNAAHELGIQLVPPRRKVDGKTITLLRWAVDYRVFNSVGLDYDATVENLKLAQAILAAALKSK
jgi:hypothetical protein